ncbi:unnamed protein product [Meloidogyne enterolobii]|uniref:Uncharacterized protein n=1 Tax=Meloidogyne enterolobii TaxID=390850 RepID=A0ACB1AQX8_MELEN
MQPDLGLTLGRGSPQGGQKRKGRVTKQPKLPKNKKAKTQHQTAIDQQRTVHQLQPFMHQPHAEIPQQHLTIPQQHSDITQLPPAIPQQQHALPQQQADIPQQQADIPQQQADIPQQQLFLISFDHQKGQNELRQRMTEFIQQIPQKFRRAMTRYMEELLTYLPNPQTQPPTLTTLEGIQHVLSGPPLTEQARKTLEFLGKVNTAEFNEQNSLYGNIEELLDVPSNEPVKKNLSEAYLTKNYEYLTRSHLRRLLKDYLLARLNEYQGNIERVW